MASSELALGILDFGYEGRDQRLESRLENTLSLARMADACGYSRFWFTEHHADNLYIACPEVTIAAIAANTRRVRVGSAGILLHYYSPFKVAEVFHTLSALFPGRVDLGLARGVGASPEAAALLRDGAAAPADLAAFEVVFERKTMELVARLREGREADVGYGAGETPASPPPEIWLMASKGGSAELAARLGAGIALALWYQYPEPVDHGAILTRYRERFQRADDGPPATVCLSLSGICAETDAEAEAIRGATNAHYGREVFLNFCGSPDRCRETIVELAARHGASEVTFVGYCREIDRQDRMFRLLAEVLAPRARASRASDAARRDALAT
jgi:luciferase family oxidoreductase group 1